MVQHYMLVPRVLFIHRFNCSQCSLNTMNNMQRTFKMVELWFKNLECGLKPLRDLGSLGSTPISVYHYRLLFTWHAPLWYRDQTTIAILWILQKHLVFIMYLRLSLYGIAATVHALTILHCVYDECSIISRGAYQHGKCQLIN